MTLKSKFLSLLALLAIVPAIALADFTVTVTAPTSGDQLACNEEYTVTWQAAGNQAAVALNVVSYSLDSGNNWTLIDTVFGETFTFDWMVPDTFSWYTRIKVESVDIEENSASGFSDGTFFISTEDSQHLFFPGWTMIALPVNPFDPDVADVIEDDMPDLRGLYGFDYNEGFFVPEQLELGRGYWLAVEHEEVYIDAQGNAELDTVEYELDQVWNMLGAPYPHISPSIGNALFRYQDTTYNLHDAVERWLIVPVFYECDAIHGYVEASWFAPWHGGWFLSIVPGVTMIVFPEAPGPQPAPVRRDDAAQGEQTNWKLSIVAQFGDLAKDRAYIGARYDATDDHDLMYDFPEPPPYPFDHQVNVYFVHDEWPQIVGNQYNSDLRGVLDNEISDWDLVVHTDVPGDITVTWPDIGDLLPAGYSITLIDGNTDTEVNMLEHDSYTYQSETDTYELSVRVVATPLVTANESVTAPQSFSLMTAFPNPFNSTTSIGYTVAEAGNVRIAVFDLAGRQVAELINGTKLAGEYNATWEAQNISAGLYLVRMQSGQFNVTQKIMLLK